MSNLCCVWWEMGAKIHFSAPVVSAPFVETFLSPLIHSGTFTENHLTTFMCLFPDSIHWLLFYCNFIIFLSFIIGVLGLPRWHQGWKICLPMQETQEIWVQSMGCEDPLEEEMATHLSLAWKMLWTEEPGRLQSIESQRVRTQLTMHVLKYNCFTMLC